MPEQSRLQQVTRLRRLAVGALDQYPLVDPQLRLVAHGENTTFRVDAREAASSASSRFLLRVHRPNRHGRDVDSSVAIRSELEWLAAIRSSTELSVPEPVRTSEGALVAVASAAHVDGPRFCSLLRWMDGRCHSRSPHPIHLHRLGDAMARLHVQADGWTPPDGFVRMTWDRETFFGNTMEYGGLPAEAVWTLVPTPLRRQFRDVAVRAGERMDALGTSADVFGLVHADLHLDNALFAGTDVRLIDFDDCGFGPRVYDLAVALWELRHRDAYPEFRDALLAGYRARRDLPDAQAALIDTFIAVREVAFGLWYVGTAQVNPEFRASLDEELGFVERSLERLRPGLRRSGRR